MEALKELPWEVEEYLVEVETEKYPVCEEQKQMCRLFRRIWEEEEVYFDVEQLRKYMSYERHFPYKLFPWEKFCFAVHNTLYKAPGVLRFPVIFICVGRGAGKTGFSAFENFCLLTETNGVKEYDIYTFAMSEKQAKMAWEDMYNILEDNPTKYRKFFHWTKEEITNLKTNSTWYYCTSSYNSKDGQRPGKVDFDEYHAYKDYRMVTAATTGLGKKALPRRTITTTNGNERGGPFDDLFEKCLSILSGEVPDNGTFPFICRINKYEDASDRRNWYMANPSYRFFPNLQQQMELEYGDYVINPAANSDFMTKRMNRPPVVMENEVTSWDNLVTASRPFDVSLIKGRSCVGAIDFAKTTDFVSAGLLFNVDGVWYWITHTWVCSNSPDLARIKAPLREWEAQGLLTFVSGPEIPPDLPVTWLAVKTAELEATMIKVGIDRFRYTLLSKALKNIYFSADKEQENNVKLVKAADEMLNIPEISSAFASGRVVWGENPLMRWFANNSKVDMTNSGNMTYQKIEPKSRKTDGFKAFAAAVCTATEAGLNGGETFDFASEMFNCYGY